MEKQPHNQRQIWRLFTTFLKIGAFTFGGGYAMIPLIQREASEKNHWISDEDILDIVAIAESTPGPIAINAATFVGYKTSGFPGAAAATLGVVLPSFTVIFIISFVLEQFQHIQAVQFAFNGIRAGVLALIVSALYTMFRQCPKYPVSYCIMAGSFIAAALLQVNVLLVIILCGTAGLISASVMNRRAKK